jgi:putative oxidoreductase
VQRFFSTFPGSWPGAGLLLLRVVAGGAAGCQGAVYLAAAPSVAAWIIGSMTAISGVSLVAGFLTPGAGVVAGLGTIAIASRIDPAAATSSVIDLIPALFVLADALALVLLGPGALSMDAHLFGRREIIIPPDRA